MTGRVEQIMQEMVPELDDLTRKELFTAGEVRHIVRRRREFEYLLQKPLVKPHDYLGYIRYEVALESLRASRKKDKHFKKRSISDLAGIRRMHFIFSRSLQKFKGDKRLWYQYIDFCLRSGATVVLSRVLLKCMKLHPREVNIWLLAADRALKCGQVKAARTLLLRAIRFVPRSSKLWSEFLRLEIQVARNVSLGTLSGAPVVDQDGFEKKSSADGSAPSQAASTPFGPWAPALLLLKRACDRLGELYEPCAAFLDSAVHCVADVRPEFEGVEEEKCVGLRKLEVDLREAIAALRPSAAKADVPPAAAKALWQLWWEQELNAGVKWPEITSSVISTAPAVVAGHFASTLVQAVWRASKADNLGGNVSTAVKSLLKLAAAPCVVADGETALALLEQLDLCAEQHASSEAAAAAVTLLRSAVKVFPGCLRLRLLACQRLPQGECPLTATDAAGIHLAAPPTVSASSSGSPGIRCETTGFESGSAAQFLAVLASQPSALPMAADEQRLATLLRGLGSDASARPLLELFLTEAFARGGSSEFRLAVDRALNVCAQLCQLPTVRAETLGVLLECECRALPLSEIRPKQLCARFEEVLNCFSDDDDAKIEWWVRYVEFSIRMTKCGRGSDVPSTMDLNWRAMRSVANQALYSDKVHGLMQSGGVA